MTTTAVMPFTSIGKSRAAALSALDVHSLIAEAGKYPTWVKPASGRFLTLEDIEGFLISGTPEDVIHDTRAYEQAGADHIVYDLRFRYGDWYEQISFLGEEVLPALRA